MKTYRDILEHYIRNKVLLTLIIHYHETIPLYRRRNVLDTEINKKFINPGSLPTFIGDLFDFDRTNEGSHFWFCMVSSEPSNKLPFIDEWKHIDEWLEDDRVPGLIRKNKEKYIDMILYRISIKREHLFFNSLKFVFLFITLSDRTHNKHGPRLTETEKRLIQFFSVYDRAPNDFDD